MSEYWNQMDFESRFWSQVEKTDSCWLWRGFIGPNGYGSIRVNGKKTRAHRAAYEHFVGPIPDGSGFHGICVLHKCDVRACVNPDHLFLGTQAENVADAASKKRMRSVPRLGESHHLSKLTESDVREIRMQYTGARGQQRRLSEQYGVSPMIVSKILRGILWKHVDG